MTDNVESGSVAEVPLVQNIEPVSDLDKKFTDAKAFLQTTSTKSGDNLYDHLSKVLTRILTERPQNVVDIFEDLSNLEKREKFVSKVDTLIEKPDKASEIKLAEVQRSLYIREGEDEEAFADQDDVDTPLPNMLELANYFEQAGVGLGKEETFRMWLAMKQLVERYPLESIRFWGKIFGIEENYYIVEVKFQDGKDEEEEGEEEEDNKNENETKDEEESEEDGDPVPKSNYKPPPVVPKEEKGTGVNKYTYFVCNAPGKPWTRLPVCTPQHIQVARKIRRFFTGRLDAGVVSYPPFPGNEANLLRAQIARISAATHISPIGFYKFDEEGEGGEEEARENYIPNEEFEAIQVRELCDINNWTHHVLHILPQGRTRWWNPKQRNEEEEIDEDEEEEKDEPDEPEPEVGPQLLTPLAEDSEIDGQPAWTAKISSNLVSQFAIAVVRSNLWPGAHAFAHDRKFENIYIGYGQKYATENFNPQLPPLPQEEFVSGPEITEAEDPTPQEEAALKKAQEAAEAEEEQQGEEEENEGEEDEDD